MTSDGTNTYEWDAENRLIKINYPGSGNYTSLMSDNSGRCTRISEYFSGILSADKQFLWTWLGVEEERDGIGAVSRSLFGRLGEKAGTSNTFYSSDHLSSVRDVLNHSGALVAQCTYDLYGTRSLLSGIDNSFRGFGGYYSHFRSGLNLSVFRWYSSKFGRWLNREPRGEANGTNLYQFCNSNPVVYVDPDGLEIRVYDSPAFGGTKCLRHVFVWSTLSNSGAGRVGISGSRLGRQSRGYPSNFDPNDPSNSYVPVPAEDFQGGEEEERNFISCVSDCINKSFLYLPPLDDCHTSLAQCFKKCGVKFPGTPHGRFWDGKCKPCPKSPAAPPVEPTDPNSGTGSCGN
ncbi:MAG: RHS repeat-associated core domain-containing protein [Candidatus Obscuribacter sp.]|nr:RHS repeat-associated core domain-containing protein [Candidatus Obscuribacter sp.]